MIIIIYIYFIPFTYKIYKKKIYIIIKEGDLYEKKVIKEKDFLKQYTSNTMPIIFFPYLQKNKAMK